MNPKNDTQSAVDAGLLAAGPEMPCAGGTPYVVLPSDAKVHSLAHLLPNPLRIERTVTLHDPASFTTYVKEFREPGTRIFFNLDSQTFTAILDYHESGSTEADDGTSLIGEQQPRWCDHVATFTPRQTPEYKAWIGGNGRARTQMEFAQFIEQHVEDVADGFGGTLLKIALNLQVKKDVTFVSQQRMEDGSVKLTYNEDVTGTSTVGQLVIPPTFALQIQPFYGGPTYRIECRFRFRLDGRVASFWYEMVRIEKLIEVALQTVREGIETGTGLTVLAGE
jgi:uncharacterized protein YfdQ (DUF2303 family)